MPITLETPRLLLRELELADAPRLEEMGNQEHLVRWQPQWQTSRETWLTWVGWMRLHYKRPGKSPQLALGITLREGGGLIGLVGVTPREPLEGQPELTCFLHQDSLGLGYAAEAVEAFCPWALRTLDLPWMMGAVARENHPAVALLRRCGFENQGPRQLEEGIVAYFRKYPPQQN